MKKKLGYLAAVGLGMLCMAPTNRGAFDHIGNFNFKVEIEGVTQGALKADTTETVTCRVDDAKEPEAGETKTLKVRIAADQKPTTKFDTIRLKNGAGTTFAFRNVALSNSALKDGEYHLVFSYATCVQLD